MRIALQIFSWLAIVLGALAIINSEGEYYALMGGGLFLTQGLLAVVYIKQQEK